MRVFRNTDGSLTVDAYSTPIHYQRDGRWEPIDNAVRPVQGRPGWVGTSANAWTVAFGPSAEGLELHTPEGMVSVTPVAAGEKSPAGRAPAAKPRPDRAPPATAEEAVTQNPGSLFGEMLSPEPLKN
jgi:hypothetical protein